jgi:protein-S-isoprenylcysteine O-methyltransferase Ste14
VPVPPEKTNFVPLLVLQCCGVLIFISAIVLSPGVWNTERWIALSIAIPETILLLVSRFQLGRSFAVTPQARELVTGGLYSKIRNPMYVFSTLVVFSFVLTVQKPYLFLLPVILVVAQIVRSRQESKVLEDKFGDTYREYRKKTWF